MIKISKALFKTTFISCLLISACSTLPAPSTLDNNTPSPLTISFSEYLDSPYQQVQAHFTTEKSKLLVYRVISDLDLTKNWFEDLKSIEALSFDTNNKYLLRSVLNSPWPFKNRELISCITTSFSAAINTVNIDACADRTTPDPALVSISQSHARWQFENMDNGQVKVSYTAWLNPEGYVPAFFYNQKLATSSKKSLLKLQRLIAKASLEDYPY